MLLRIGDSEKLALGIFPEKHRMKKYNSLKSFYDQPKDGKKIGKEQQKARKAFTKNRETGKVKARQLGKLNY